MKQVRSVQPQFVVQVGDIYDDFSLSRYARSLNVTTPAKEASEGRKWAEEMWAEVAAASPKSKRIQIKGNHDDRLSKRLLEACPEAEAYTDVNSRFRFEGVRLVDESFEELFLGDVVVQHGHKKFGTHAPHNLAPTITGHTHHGGVAFFQNRRGVYWELNAGFGGDVNSPVFRYRSQKHLHGWTLGLGIVDALGPRFVPFP